MVRAHLLGFYMGMASIAQITFQHVGQNLLDPNITLIPQAKLKNFQGSGSQVIMRRIFSADPSFASYRMSRQGIDLTKPPGPQTVEDAARLVENYIQACIDNRHLDPECELIGGRIHVGKVNKRHGFEWIKPPLAVPTPE
jgi:hypothetical protein